MLFSNEDRALTKNLYEFKKFSSRRYLAEFSKKNQQIKRNGRVTKKISKSGSTDQKHESGRLKHGRTEESVTTVDKMVGLLN